VPAICRGNSVDADVPHCSTPRRDELSPDVFVNGTGISRQGDNNTSEMQYQDVRVLQQVLRTHLLVHDYK
jgi:hypothetical protein